MAIKIPQTLSDELVRQNIVSQDELAKIVQQAQKEEKELGRILHSTSCS